MGKIPRAWLGFFLVNFSIFLSIGIIVEKKLAKMPDKTFKISVDGVAEGVGADKIREEFTKFGKILDIAGEAGTFTVTFESLEEAQDAIYSMDGKEFHGHDLNVELVEEDEEQMDTTENGKENGHENADKGTKIFVGNLGNDGKITNDVLRPLFEKFGKVTECECMGKFAFVHMETEAEATEAVKELNGHLIKDRNIKVEKGSKNDKKRGAGGGKMRGGRGGGSVRNGIPAYLCFNPACKHVQDYGECVRYKSPCPKSSEPGQRGRGAGGRRGGGSFGGGFGGGFGGPPQRAGPYGRGYGPPGGGYDRYGPPMSSMYDSYGPPSSIYEPYNDYGPQMDYGFSRGGGGGGGDGPPFQCFNPNCKHVQQFGECVRYKSPCPNSGGGGNFRGGRGRGRARGRARGGRT